MDDQNVNPIINENQFLRAAAHGLSDRLSQAESLLAMALEFMTSVEYDTAIDAAQCVAIATSIERFLERTNDNE